MTFHMILTFFREEVRRLFAVSEGFSDWHPEVLNIHIEHSTRDAQERGKLTRVLKTPNEQEAVGSHESVILTSMPTDINLLGNISCCTSS